ncbi:MAG: hypothetical protein KDB03_21770 [Planctomycetales bacterium]|nr:hypothetical protein [Planctomycetales bacterium]
MVHDSLGTRITFSAAISLLLLAYGLLFLREPSVLGLSDERGQLLSRAYDFLQVFLLGDLVNAFFGHGRLPIGIVDRLPIILAASAWLGSAIWVGGALMVRVQIPLTHVERHSLACLVGLALFSTTTLVIGSFGQLHSRWPLVVALISLVACAYFLRSTPIPRSTTAKSRAADLIQSFPDQVAFRLTVISVFALSVVYLLGGLVTPWEFDVLEYHLQAPKEFYQQGRISFVENNVYANMPLGAEMHSLAWMVILGTHDGWWLGALIGKLITSCMTLMSACLLWGHFGRRFDRATAWCAALSFLAMPGMAHVAMAGLIDGVLGTYVLAALLVVVELWRKRQAERAIIPIPETVLLGMLSGAAAGCKYPGLLLSVLPTTLAFCFVFRAPPGIDGRAIKKLCWFVGSVCVTGGGWYLKNGWFTGNPFYPLVHGWFGARALTLEQLSRFDVAHASTGFGIQNLAESFARVGWQSDFLQPAIIPLALLGLLSAITWKGRDDRQSIQIVVAWIAWILMVWWFGTHRIDRFWLPAVPLLCILAAVGWNLFARRASLALATGWLLVASLYGTLVLTSVMGDNRFFVSLAALRVDEGNDEFPGRISPVVNWINENLDEHQDQVLLIGEAKAFDFRIPVVYATCFNTNPGEIWLAESSGRRERLSQAGITYILINWSEIARYRSPGNYGFSEWPKPENIEQWLASGLVSRVPWSATREDLELLKVVPP